MVSGLLSGIAGGATVAITIKAVDEFSSAFNKATSGIGSLGTAFKVGAAAIATTGAAIAAIGVSSIKSAADIEQVSIAFETMLGSAEAADQMMRDIFEFAKSTPFEVEGLVTASKQLLAYGFTQEEVLTNLESLGNIAAGVGQDKLPNLILAFGQVRAAGKLTGQELRQFTEAGVPLLEELANSFGVTTGEIKELISSGEVGFQDVQIALANLSGEGGRFEGLMVKQMDSVAGKFSNVKDAIFQMKLELGEALIPVVSEFVDVILKDVLPALKPLIPILADLLKNAVKFLTPLIADLAEKFVVLAEFVLRDVIPTFEPFIPIVMELASVIFDTAMKVLEALMPAFQVLLPPIIKIIEALLPFIDLLAEVIVIAAELIAQFAEMLAPVIDDVADAFVEIAPILAVLVEAVVIVIKWVADLIGKLFDIYSAVKEKFAPAFDWMKNLLGALISPIKTLIGWYEDLIGTIKDFLGIDDKASKKSSKSSKSSSSSSSSGSSSSSSSGSSSSGSGHGGGYVAPTIYLNDFILTKDGKIIKPSSQDTIMGMKNPGSMGGMIVVNIDNVYGTDASDIAVALQRELSRKVSLS